MASRTLLLVTYHFPPSAAVAVYRMLGFVRYLPRFGWNTVVVAPPSMPDEPVDPALLRLVPEGTPVFRVPFPTGLTGKIARRVGGNIAWLPPAIEECARIIPRFEPDAFLTSSPPPAVHYLGMYLKRHYGLPWVASLRDPWHTNRGHATWWRGAWTSLMEGRMVRRADAVVANTPLNLEGLRAAYPAQAKKMRAIPNGFDPEWFPPAPSRNGPPHELTLLHAGELYSGRDPRPLLDALARIKAEGIGKQWRLKLLGRATEGLCDLPAEISRRHLQGQVEVQEQVPYADALTQMMQSDVLLLLHSPGFRIGVPAKLYEYLGAGRPILALAEPEGDIAWVLNQSGVLHRLAPPGDVSAIAQALRELRDELATGAAAASRPPRQSPFTRENMARRMAQCLDQVVGHAGGSRRVRGSLVQPGACP
jgi:glycosyltransferase involved in cell wall biosynthesis